MQQSDAIIKAGDIIALGIVLVAGVAAGTVMAVSRQLAHTLLFFRLA